jgi:hypothetical protein
MQNFVNNWSALITLAEGTETLAVDLPDGSYRITISDALDATATRWEIAEALVVSGSATLTRGIEGTLEQDWPAGSVMYISMTAGFLEGLQQVIAAQQLLIADLAVRVAALEGGVTVGALTNASGDVLTNATGQVLTTGAAA